MNSRVYNVLFICTGNSARSIMAESILNQLGRGRFLAFSAGSHPAGKVHPQVVELLQRNRFETSALRSKSWDEFAQAQAPQMDFVLTVCDKAAGEVCPYWPGQPVSAHWGVEDPASAQGNDDQKRKAFSDAFRILNIRISMFLSLPLEKLDKLALTKQLEEIGKISDGQVVSQA